MTKILSIIDTVPPPVLVVLIGSVLFGKVGDPFHSKLIEYESGLLIFQLGLLYALVCIYNSVSDKQNSYCYVVSSSHNCR